MFGWIKESAVYEAGLIGSGSWDEESSSYKVQLPAEVLQEAARVMDKGYLFFVHGTIEAADGATEFYLQANKLETQTTPDGEVMYISFADGSTLTEGLLTIPYGEGGGTPAIHNIWDSTGTGAVAGGNADSEATGNYAFAFGTNAKATGYPSAAFGNGQALSDNTYAFGSATAEGRFSFASGNGAKASGANSVSMGVSTMAMGNNSHAEGNGTTASGDSSHSEGDNTKAYGRGSHAEGYKTEAGTSNNSKKYAHAEGNETKATGESSHAEGNNTKAYGKASHAEGASTVAGDSSKTNVICAHAEGNSSEAKGSCSHAEGWGTKAYGENSHSEGSISYAYGYYSHAEGSYCEAGSESNANTITCQHAEGRGTLATGLCSHAEGDSTIASGDHQHVSGMYNIEDDTSLEIIGNGTSIARSNARTLDKAGNEWLAGQIQPELGLRLKAPNGTYYNVTVDNTGALSIVAAT